MSSGGIHTTPRASLCDDAPVMVPAGPNGPGGWSCHTFEDGETLRAICLADDCPDRDKRNPDRFKGEVLGWA